MGYQTSINYYNGNSYRTLYTPAFWRDDYYISKAFTSWTGTGEFETTVNWTPNYTLVNFNPVLYMFSCTSS